MFLLGEGIGSGGLTEAEESTGGDARLDELGGKRRDICLHVSLRKRIGHVSLGKRVDEMRVENGMHVVDVIVVQDLVPSGEGIYHE